MPAATSAAAVWPRAKPRSQSKLEGIELRAWRVKVTWLSPLGTKQGIELRAWSVHVRWLSTLGTVDGIEGSRGEVDPYCDCACFGDPYYDGDPYYYGDPYCCGAPGSLGRNRRS